MRGTDTKQATMLSVLTPERRVPANHPLRAVKKLADAALVELSPTFDAMYSAVGRPSIPPERLLKASLLMALYTVRSERLFCEQLDYNLLFLPRAQRHPARREERRTSPQLSDRRTHDQTLGLLDQPGHTKARRGDLWLDQDGRELPEDALQRPRTDAIGLVPRRRGLQPDEDGQTADSRRGLNGAEDRPANAAS